MTVFKNICRALATVVLIIVVLIGAADVGKAASSASLWHSIAVPSIAIESLLILAMDRTVEKIWRKSDQLVTRADEAVRTLHAIIVARWRNSA